MAVEHEADTPRAASDAHAQVIARRVHGTPPPPAADVVVYSGLVTRVIAFAVDAAVINTIAIVVGATVALVFSLVPSLGVPHEVVVVIGATAFVLWVVGYFLTFWTTTGQTPGNRFMRVKVQRTDGSRLKPRHALMRMLGILLSLPLFWGFVGILVTDRRRGFYDWLAGTVVVGAPDQGGWRAIAGIREAG